MALKLVPLFLEPLNALSHINVTVCVNYVLVPISQNKTSRSSLSFQLADLLPLFIHHHTLKNKDLVAPVLFSIFKIFEVKFF